MRSLQNISFLFPIALTGVSLPSAMASNPYVVSDERVRSLDVTPVLGRGYSIMTNTFHSNCLMIDETTTPSYNYDYSFYDFSSFNEYQIIGGEGAKKLGHSFAFPWFQSEVESSAADIELIQEPTSVKYLTSSMRIERYYSSIKEDSSTLINEAKQLLTRRDWIGFFKACGSSYVRSIRRAQEVTAFFIFKSVDNEEAQRFAQSVQVASWKVDPDTGASTLVSRQPATSTNSLKIVIKGYGLGLSQDGSETLVARSLEEYNKVIRFAFRTMTVNPHTFDIGMVYGMEVAPWVHNTEFIIESNVIDEPIEMETPYSLIPRAYLISDPKNTVFDNLNRILYRCKNPLYSIDKNGLCCERSYLYDVTSLTYDFSDPSNRVCKPTRTLPPYVMKENLTANAEFVARLDATLRDRMNSISILQMCISAARAIPERYDFNVLKSPDSVKLGNHVEIEVTPFELKQALDPFNDFSTLTHMAQELDEFILMYIQPCYAALFGTNIGTSPGTDSNYFMAMPWYTHSACTKISCLSKGMRWDRSSADGGCVPGLMFGVDSPDIESDNSCSKSGPSNTCQYPKSALNSYREKLIKCWETTVPRGSIFFLMDKFCMPRIHDYAIDPMKVQVLKRNSMFYCSGGDISNTVTESIVNVALHKPATQSSTYSHYGSSALPQLANDGNIDGNMWRRSVSHTHYAATNWWQVDLQGRHKIKEVKVYNRTDGSDQRLLGFKVVLYNTDSTITSSTTPVWTSEEQQGENGVIGFETVVTVPKVTGSSSIEPEYQVANKVRIILENKYTWLHMAEVEVMAVTTSSDYSEPFAIVNESTGKAINVSDCGETGVAGSTELKRRDSSVSQLFKYNYKTKEVYHEGCSKVLDIETSTCDHNKKIILMEMDEESESQKWVFENDNTIRNFVGCPGQVVAIKDQSRDDGAEIVIQSRDTDWHKKFRIVYV